MRKNLNSYNNGHNRLRKKWRLYYISAFNLSLISSLSPTLHPHSHPSYVLCGCCTSSYINLYTYTLHTRKATTLFRIVGVRRGIYLFIPFQNISSFISLFAYFTFFYCMFLHEMFQLNEKIFFFITFFLFSF